MLRRNRWGLNPTIIILLLFLSLVFKASAQDSAQWVIDNFLEKTGGKALWEQTMTVRRSGISTSYNGGYTGTQPESEFLFYQQVIDRNGDANTTRVFLSDNHIDSSFFCHESGKVSMSILYKDGSTRFEHMEGDDHFDFKYFDLQLSFLDVDRSLWSYEGIVTVADRTYYVINYRTPGVNGSQYFFDVTSGLLVSNEGKNPPDLIEYEDYQEIEGRKIPMSMKHYRFGKLIFHRRHAQVEYGVDVKPCYVFLPYRDQ